MSTLRALLYRLTLIVTGLLLWTGCQTSKDQPGMETNDTDIVPQVTTEGVQDVPMYAPVELTADLSHLSDNQREMIRLFIEAADIMDDLFWKQAYGQRDSLLNTITQPDVRRYVQINYGPWDRLNGNRPFIEGVGPKPPGANYYPAGMSKEAFNQAAEDRPGLESLYTLVRRNESGDLQAVPYREAFEPQLEKAASLLREAAELSETESLRRYLELRAEALTTDDYRSSDMAWMEMKDNLLELVIGPIETYEDNLFGYKAAYEGFVLLKDQEWSQRLAKYTEMLPMLQEELPVPPEYKKEEPGREAELNAYQALYYAGDANAGAKTIAINLPNDEEVQLEKGTRRLQLKNAMRAKFDKILVPIAGELMAEEQREHVTFDAFFSNTMFHEVAHGLGIKNTITGKGTAREALRDHYTTIEEGKADILGLYMVRKLNQEDALEVDLMDHYVTFMASIFRSIRFGTASAHGRANLIRFNYFREKGAFTRDAETGTYQVHPEEMETAMQSLSEDILRLQGDGNYPGTARFIEQYAQMTETLEQDLTRLSAADIPVDIVFEQGVDELGL